MITLWMLSAIVFTAFLALAAWWAERALRAAGRPTRGAWLFALAAGTLWPVLVPLLRWLRPAPDTVTAGVTMLDAIRVVPERVTSGVDWLPLLDRIAVTAWLVVSALLLLRYVQAWCAVRALRRASEQAVVDGVCVLVSRDLGPAVVGVRRAAVLVSRAVLDLDAPLRALVLRHEEEHRRARDTWLLLALAVAVATMPWNLPLWWIAHRARLALEVDCDARVLAAGANFTRYAQVLLLAAQRRSAAPLTPMLVASRTHLERRIAAMQDRITQETQGRRRTWRIAGASAACVIALALASASPIAGQAPTNRVANATRSRESTITPASPVSARQAPTTQLADTVGKPKPTVTKQPYFEFQVEKPVQLASGSANPVYPVALKAANVSGVVLAQFVVDTLGRAETFTFKVLKSDHQLFTEAVKNVLPGLRFIPAEVGGRKVKQLVQQPFTFSTSKSEVGPVEIPNPQRPD
ncbi:MAG TPA: M56 family metallopeptidase [Gemmatimonadaceae bacterium]|nr:M56 family metallopeptidase [Gemmatimonadaceae bacterium]